MVAFMKLQAFADLYVIYMKKPEDEEGGGPH
jgi:hypothetical protein